MTACTAAADSESDSLTQSVDVTGAPAVSLSLTLADTCTLTETDCVVSSHCQSALSSAVTASQRSADRITVSEVPVDRAARCTLTGKRCSALRARGSLSAAQRRYDSYY